MKGKKFPTCDTKQPLCACARSSMGSEIFHNFEVAFMRTRKQLSMHLRIVCWLHCYITWEVWCWLHCLHQNGYHSTATVTCTASVSKLYINVYFSVNCEILCNIKSPGHRNFSKSQELTIYTEWFTTFYRYYRSMFLGSFGTENVNYKIGSDW